MIIIILDPPSFTRARGKINDALARLSGVAPPKCPALLTRMVCWRRSRVRITCPADEFESVGRGRIFRMRSVRRVSSGDSGRSQIIPMLLNLPETFYLKGLLLDVMAGR